MTRIVFLIIFSWGILVGNGQPFQLAVPLVKYTSLIFEKEAGVSCSFNQPGTQIRYTIDGSEPGENSSLYSRPITIRGGQVQFKARVFGAGFEPSEPVVLNFIKTGLKVASVTGSAPSEKYAANGLASLYDGQGGQPDIGNGLWLGYELDSISWLLKLKQAAQPKQLLLHCLQQQGSWIFLPQRIVVYAMDNASGQYQQVGELATTVPTAEAPGGVMPLVIDLKQVPKTSQLKLLCFPLMKIPAWHSGAGTRAWTFIDEIIVY